jgi:hypothetical protein
MGWKVCCGDPITRLHNQVAKSKAVFFAPTSVAMIDSVFAH